jgi:DNA-binding response OmpR family regulator
VGEGLPAVVQKPVSPADLLARVRAELDRPRAAHPPAAAAGLR